MLVAQSFVEDPRCSAKRSALQLDLSRRSFHRIARELGYHVYRPTLLHALSEDDFDRRMEFAKWYI